MKPLTKIKRKILLLALIVVFLILGPWILLNSFGYKLDEAFGIVKTGGLYLHTDLSGASVYVGGEYIKDNGVLFRDVFVQKLKPNQTYKIEVYRDGYNGWVKEIYVYPSLVSEGNVLMLPLEFEKREIFPFSDAEGNGSYTPISGLTMVRKTSDGRIIPENQEYIEIVTLFEGENPYQIKKPEIKISENVSTSTSKKELPEHFEKLGIENPDNLESLIETSNEISWLENGNIVLYWVDEMENITFYYCRPQELEKFSLLSEDKKRVCNNQIILDWEDEIERFEYYPGRGDVWIVLVDSGIYAVEVDPRSDRNIQKIYEGDNLDFRLDDSANIIVKDKGSYFELAL